MIKIVYFAKTRETLGKAEETMPLAPGINTVATVVESLLARGEPYTLAFEEGRILAAVNQEMVSRDTHVTEGDEVAFFPPVTGG